MSGGWSEVAMTGIEDERLKASVPLSIRSLF